MEKVFICGLAVSGKGLMKQLLDGHSRLSMAPFQGYILKNLVSYKLDSLSSNPRFSNPNRAEFYRNMPHFFIKDGNKTYKMYYDEFIRYIYYDYDLRIACRSGTLYAEAGKGSEALVDFSFDYPSFEDKWYTRLFSERTHVTVEEFLDIMYETLIQSWTNKYIRESDIKAVITTVQNGVEPIKWLLKSTKNSKFILMKRDVIGFSYAFGARQAIRLKTSISNTLYNFSIINNIKKYNSFVNKVASDSRVLVVNFEKLVLDTENTMKKIAEFLKVGYEDVMKKATLNKAPLETEASRFTGKINEDPYKLLKKEEIDFLKFLYKSPDLEVGILKKILFFIRALILGILFKSKEYSSKVRRLILFLKGTK